jgi:DNA helicase-2/ATP-dependent DNA helicase PcrA
MLPGITLVEFLSEAALVADVDSYQDAADCVTLMTMHAAQGLEFPIVFIAGLEEGILPHHRSLSDGGDIEEERRLFYVAMTRARERLYLSYAQYRTIWGSRDFQEPSRFLREIEPAKLRGWTIPPERRYSRTTLEDADDFEFRTPRATQRFERALSPVKSNGLTGLIAFKIGDLVEHPEFGLGVVTAKSGDAENLKVRVAFEGMGSKLLAVKYAPLKRAD